MSADDVINLPYYFPYNEILCPLHIHYLVSFHTPHRLHLVTCLIKYMNRLYSVKVCFSHTQAFQAGFCTTPN